MKPISPRSIISLLVVASLAVLGLVVLFRPQPVDLAYDNGSESVVIYADIQPIPGGNFSGQLHGNLVGGEPDRAMHAGHLDGDHYDQPARDGECGVEPDGLCVQSGRDAGRLNQRLRDQSCLEWRRHVLAESFRPESGLHSHGGGEIRGQRYGDLDGSKRALSLRAGELTSQVPS